MVQYHVVLDKKQLFRQGMVENYLEYAVNELTIKEEMRLIKEANSS